MVHDRRVERSKGCFCCAHFDCGDAAVARVKARMQADAAHFASQGVPLEKMPQKLQGLEQILDAVDHGQVGICTSLTASEEMAAKAGCRVDFVERTYLCHNWDRVAGASLIEKKKVTDDVLPDELLDRAGLPQAQNPGDDNGGSST